MTDIRKRPDSLVGRTIRTLCGCGKIYVTINELDGEPFEVFVSVGKSGSCIATTVGALAISISHGLRAGISLEEYKKAMIGFKCQSPLSRIENQGQIAQSCIDAIARVFMHYMALKEQMKGKPKPVPSTPPAPAPKPIEEKPKIPEEPHKEVVGRSCEECGGPVYMSEGCDHCVLCGHSQNCQD